MNDEVEARRKEESVNFLLFARRIFALHTPQSLTGRATNFSFRPSPHVLFALELVQFEFGGVFVRRKL